MKKTRKAFESSLLAAAGLALVAGCDYSREVETRNSTAAPSRNPSQPPISQAVAVIEPTEGNNVQGVVRFTQTEQGVRIVADLQGLTPGKHGIHIHESGDCSAPDGSSAGGHFNPGNQRHGGPGDAERHAGDFGNLVADETGKAHWERVDKHVSFEGKTSILDRAVIIHEGEDDLKSQPSGNAGKRIGCGVISVTQDVAGAP